MCLNFLSVCFAFQFTTIIFCFFVPGTNDFCDSVIMSDAGSPKEAPSEQAESTGSSEAAPKIKVVVKTPQDKKNRGD